MDHRKIALILSVFLFLFLGIAREGLANKASVTIQAPASAQKGSEIVIRINVSHDGNNFFHYVNWVYVSVNGKEVVRWTFSSSDRPEAGNFSREVKVSVNGNSEIVTEANCNLHGSAGPAKFRTTAD